MPSADQPASGRLAPAVGSNPQPVLLVQSSLEPHDAADLEIAPKEVADEGGMLLDDMAARHHQMCGERRFGGAPESSNGCPRCSRASRTCSRGRSRADPTNGAGLMHARVRTFLGHAARAVDGPAVAAR